MSCTNCSEEARRKNASLNEARQLAATRAKQEAQPYAVCIDPPSEEYLVVNFENASEFLIIEVLTPGA